MWIAQTIGIEGLAGLSLAAGEAHTTFSLIRLGKGVSQFIVASPALTPFSFLPTISHVMSISCQVVEMILGAGGRGLSSAAGVLPDFVFARTEPKEQAS